MALKFEIQGTALTVTDTVTSEIKLDRPAKETYYQSHELDNGNIVLYDTSGVNPYSSYIYKNTLTGSVDSNDVQFTAETFRTFVHENLGKSSPQVSGQIEIWDLYGHSGTTYSYTPGVSDPFVLPNDGAYNNNFNLSNAFNTVTNQLDLSGFFVGSNLELTLDFDFVTSSNNQEVELLFYGSIGNPNEWFGRVGTPVTFKSSGNHGVNFHVKYPIEFQSDLDFHAEIRVVSDGDLVITPKFLHIVTKKQTTGFIS